MEQILEKEETKAERLDLLPLIPSTHSHFQLYYNFDVGVDHSPYARTNTTCVVQYMEVTFLTTGRRPEHGDNAHNDGVAMLKADPRQADVSAKVIVLVEDQALNDTEWFPYIAIKQFIQTILQFFMLSARNSNDLTRALLATADSD